jgi:tRNA(adenine34) deaminase
MTTRAHEVKGGGNVVDEGDERGMRLALGEAAQAAMRGEVPVGAVVLLGGQVIGAGSNARESAQDPTAHAEIVALRQAAARIGSWRLCGATLYVTQEPCLMCAGAIVNARVERLVYGCPNPKAGAVRTLYQVVEDVRLNHRVVVRAGVLAQECGALLTMFFENLRARKRAQA